MSELKPCPFCTEPVDPPHVGHHGGWSQVHCDNCGAKGSLAASDLAAIAAWNRRPTPSPVAAGVPGSTDAERAAWLADKIGALGDYAKEAASMLRRWPVSPIEEKERNAQG